MTNHYHDYDDEGYTDNSQSEGDSFDLNKSSSNNCNQTKRKRLDDLLENKKLRQELDDYHKYLEIVSYDDDIYCQRGLNRNGEE